MTAEQIIIQTVKQLPIPTKGHVIYYDELLNQLVLVTHHSK